MRTMFEQENGNLMYMNVANSILVRSSIAVPLVFTFARAF